MAVGISQFLAQAGPHYEQESFYSHWQDIPPLEVYFRVIKNQIEGVEQWCFVVANIHLNNEAYLGLGYFSIFMGCGKAHESVWYFVFGMRKKSIFAGVV